METETHYLADITILIPLRVDSEERRDNMDTCLSFFAAYPEVRILVLEADIEPKYKPVPINNLEYFFMEDPDPVFYRTHYLNILLRKAQTPVAGIWDSDVIIPVNQIVEAIKKVKDGATLCYPYDGRFYNISPLLSLEYKKTINIEMISSNQTHQLAHGYYSVGGAFVVDVAKYLSAGGENEHFYGWGPEDTERRERIHTWGLKVQRTEGCLYHLYHSRGINSNYANEERELFNRQEYLKICKMTSNELKDYILNSSWVKNNV